MPDPAASMPPPRWRLPALTLCLLYGLFLGHLALSTQELPDRVATHFNARGQADNWMTRTTHLAFMALTGLGVPLFVVGVCYVVRFVSDDFVNVPHREYWLAPDRRRRTMDDLVAYALWLACLLVAMFVGLQYLVVQANTRTPPRLSSSALVLLGAFLVGVLVWIVLLYRHFSHPAPEGTSAHTA